MQLSPRLFWLANVASALVWAPLLLLAGDGIAVAGERMIGSENTLLLLFGGMALCGILAALWAVFRAARSKGKAPRAFPSRVFLLARVFRLRKAPLPLHRLVLRPPEPADSTQYRPQKPGFQHFLN